MSQEEGEAVPGPSAASPHLSVVLFYKYFVQDGANDYSLFRQHASHYVPLLVKHQKQLCKSLGMRGRILFSDEGVNGTLSASSDDIIQKYIYMTTKFDVLRDLGPPPTEMHDSHSSRESMNLFTNVDWKLSTVSEQEARIFSSPFPDLKISSVKEIVSTGGIVTLDDIPRWGGKHLTPDQFHEALLGEGESEKEVVLIDVRNTFEHAIGHFVNPNASSPAGATNCIGDSSQPAPAINPQMTNFTQFDTHYSSSNADYLRDKKVLMYCTGGIRCEKASAMLRKRGVDDISQLSGGIHRYLEKYGNSGLFHGKNFTFDQRVAIDPGTCIADSRSQNFGSNDARSITAVVGKCLECAVPYDEISGSRLCTVCRDLVLICPSCCSQLRELHCERHSGWKECYYTFLEVFDDVELENQLSDLKAKREGLIPASEHKSTRKTLAKQMEKVRSRIARVRSGDSKVDRSAPRRCRTCKDTEDVCDGLCWGFWKKSGEGSAKEHLADGSIKRKGVEDEAAAATSRKVARIEDKAALNIAVGDYVLPGSDWNEFRLGPKTAVTTGKVVEVKSWGSRGSNDCVAVVWSSQINPKIYRWGVVSKNGRKMYDVAKCDPT